MEYLTGYPTTKHKHDEILVVVDIFSKMDIFIPCKKTKTTQQTSHLFFEHVWKHYGLILTNAISDRDVIFVNIFWNTLWKQLDMIISLLTAFHLQTNRQTEVVNRLTVQLLCVYNHKHRQTWDESLPYIQHSYNNSQHNSMGKSSFNICYGSQSSMPINLINSSTQSNDTDSDWQKVEKALMF